MNIKTCFFGNYVCYDCFDKIVKERIKKGEQQ